MSEIYEIIAFAQASLLSDFNYCPIFMKRSSVTPLKHTLISYIAALQTQKSVMWERQ